MDNFFSSWPLLRLLKKLGIAAAENAVINGDKKAPLKSVREMEKLWRALLTLLMEIMLILLLLDAKIID